MRHFFTFKFDLNPKTKVSTQISDNGFDEAIGNVSVGILNRWGCSAKTIVDSGRVEILAELKDTSFDIYNINLSYFIYIPYFRMREVTTTFVNAVLPLSEGNGFLCGEYHFRENEVDYLFVTSEESRKIEIKFKPNLNASEQEMEKQCKNYKAFLEKISFSLTATQHLQNLLSAVEQSNAGFKTTAARELYKLIGKHALEKD